MGFWNGITYVALGDPATGNFVEFTDLTGDLFYETVPVGVGETGPTGSPLQPSDRSVCRFSFLPSDGLKLNQMRQWMNNQTRVHLFALGPGQAIVWNEADPIHMMRRPVTGFVRGRSDVWDVTIERRGHGRHDIHGGVSLLAKNGWHEGSVSGLANGYTHFEPGTGVSTPSFASGEQANLADELSGIYYDVFCPIQAISFDFEFSVHGTVLHPTTSTFKFQRQWLENDLTVINTSFKDPSSVGRDSINITSAPTDAFWLRLWIMIQPTATLGSQSVKDPACRVDGETTYLLH